MSGRSQTEIKIKNKTLESLSEMPDYVTSFYYSFSASKEPKTCSQYIYHIKNFLEWTNKDIRDVTDEDIGRYFEKISYKNKNGKMEKTSDSYRQITWTVLNQFFSYLHKKKLIEDNPMELIKRPNNKDVVKRVSLTMDDLNAILNAAANTRRTRFSSEKAAAYRDRDVLILSLFMETGMRKTALSEMDIEDIDFEEKKIRIIDKRKTTQVYDLSPRMESLIMKWINKRNKLRGSELPALFLSKNGNRLSSQSIVDLVEKYSREGLGYSITPHKLRAAFVTLYYEASGNDIVATCEAVGHANIETTSRYIVRKNNSRSEAVNFMSSNLKA